MKISRKELLVRKIDGGLVGISFHLKENAADKKTTDSGHYYRIGATASTNANAKMLKSQLSADTGQSK